MAACIIWHERSYLTCEIQFLAVEGPNDSVGPRDGMCCVFDEGQLAYLTKLLSVAVDMGPSFDVDAACLPNGWKAHYMRPADVPPAHTLFHI